MGNPFGSLSNAGLEKSEDRVGGGFSVLDSDIYTGKLKAAYAIKSQGGAQGVSLIFVPEGKSEHRETVYVTKKTGENFYVKDGKKYPMPGFTLIDDICLLLTDAPLSEQETEEKIINVWNADEKKELPTAVQMLTGLLDKEISFAIQKVLENKSEKQGNDYVATAETRESANIVKALHTQSKLTVAEAREGKEEAVYWDAWLEKNKGQTYDKRTIKDGSAGAAGKPPVGGKAPGAGDGQPRKSLFGNKG